MQLEHSFTVPVPPEQAWQALLDVEGVAPCMPGATVDSVDGDVVKGRIKVKVGPVTLTYSGTARFVERDDEALSITLEASGKETRGSGTASAKVRSTLRNESGQTQVVVYTTLSVTGRPAQFGRGVMAEVSGKIIQQFATNLAVQLGGEKPPAGQASGNGAVPGAGASGTAPPSGGGPVETSAAGSAGTGSAGSAGTGSAGSAGTGSAGSAGTGSAGSAGTATAGQAQSAGAPAAVGTTQALSIEELRLPVRAFNSLRRAGIHTLGDLSARSEGELLAIENLGPQSVKEIKHKLAELGAHLSTTEPEATASAAPAPSSAAQGAAADGARSGGAPARAPASASTAADAGSSTPAQTAAGTGSGGTPTTGTAGTGIPATGTAGTGTAATGAAGTGAGATAPGPAGVPAGPSAATAPPRSARPADQDVIDLLDVAGVPVLKRALPVLGGVAAALFVFLRLRRHRGRHRAGG